MIIRRAGTARKDGGKAESGKRKAESGKRKAKAESRNRLPGRFPAFALRLPALAAPRRGRPLSAFRVPLFLLPFGGPGSLILVFESFHRDVSRQSIILELASIDEGGFCALDIAEFHDV